MKVLVACEFSDVVRQEFEKKGHDAWSCDILPTEGNKDKHFQCDITQNNCDLLNWEWDLMIAHPPCTRLCNSGVRWLNERDLWDELDKATEFFNMLKNAPIDKICIENPIPNKYAKKEIGEYTQIIQPYMFGHGETKATCLWLKNLPKLVPTNIVEGREQRIHKMPPGKNRGKERSRTYKGIAEAMAEQWG